MLDVCEPETVAKYCLVKSDSKLIDGVRVYRLEALIDFGKVKKGDKGGYIEDERNLSHAGTCWVFEEGVVYDLARVDKHARVSGHGRMKDRALATDETHVTDYAVIGDDAELRGRTSVGGESTVGGNARLRDSTRVTGRPHIAGNVQLHGRAIIWGSPVLDGCMEIGGDTWVMNQGTGSSSEKGAVGKELDRHAVPAFG